MQGWGLCKKGSPSPWGFCVIPVSPTNGNQMAGDMLGGICVGYQAVPTKTKRALPITIQHIRRIFGTGRV